MKTTLTLIMKKNILNNTTINNTLLYGDKYGY